MNYTWNWLVIISDQYRNGVFISDGPQRDDGLVPDDRLLDGGQRLQRRQETADVLRTSDQWSESTKLLGELQQDFVLLHNISLIIFHFHNIFTSFYLIEKK